ncbi:MAG: cell division protein FtsQ/DivIB [Actinomycetaceae bacterium]|nr:cell division protein FtsQ/DivIB [Actinomycetaceae bacterium]
MARKPRSPRTPRALSLETESAYSPAMPLDIDATNRDSVPTADLSAEGNPFVVVDEPIVQIDGEESQETAVVRDIFSGSSFEEQSEEKDSLLARVNKRRKKKQGDGDDEVSARRAQNKAVRRRSVRLRVLIAVLVCALLAGGGYLIFFSSLFSLSLANVTISAPDDSPINENDIRTTLTPYEGQSLARLSSDTLARHIEEEVAGTDNVKVRRVVPHGLSVSYSLKEPYACLVIGEACKPIDDTGRLIPETATTDIPSLIHIVHSGKTTDVARVMEPAQSVLAVLDETVRASTARLEVDGANNIRLVLNDGRVVIWGQVSDNERKAEVLAVLLSQPATTYDISAPEAPVTR